MSAIIPAYIKAGLSTKRIADLRQYPAPSWSLTLILRGPSALDVTSTAEGSRHVLTLTAAQTGALAAGHYSYSVRATSGDDTVEVEASTVDVIADLSTVAAGADQRSHARRVLDNIEAVIENRATQDQQKYRINNRELWRTPLADLLQLRGYYAALVRQEKAKARGKTLFGAAVKVRL